MRILPAERTHAWPMLALALWALLLAGAGVVEARYQFVRNQLERTAAEADLIRTGIETYLSAGLPLDQFLGFKRLSEATFAADKALQRIEVQDAQGDVLFARPEAGARHDWGAADLFAPVPRLPGEPRWTPPKDLSLGADDDAFRLALPLSNRFEAVGRTALATPRHLVRGELRRVAAPVGVALALLVVAYYPLARGRVARGDAPRAGKWNGTFATLALLMALAVLAALYQVYADSMRDKAGVLARSLGERLEQSVDLGLDLASFEGIDRLFDEYQRSNPDVGFVTLVVGNIVTLHTDKTAERGRWRQPGDSFTAIVEVQPRRVFSSQVRVALGIDKALVYREVAYSAARLLLGAVVLAIAWVAVLNAVLALRRPAPVDQAVEV